MRTRSTFTLVAALLALSSVAHAATAAEEREEIFTLLAYSIAWVDWQPGGPAQRGYNAATVLVDKNDAIQFWARNCALSPPDVSRHADVLAMQKHLEAIRTTYLTSYKLFSSLEPCAMCAGMTVMGSLSRVVHGQADARAGGVLQIYRNHGRTTPTPVAAPTTYRAQLESAFAASGATSTEEWLFSTTARDIFRAARDRLVLQYLVAYPENQAVLDAARAALVEAQARPGACHR